MQIIPISAFHYRYQSSNPTCHHTGGIESNALNSAFNIISSIGTLDVKPCTGRNGFIIIEHVAYEWKLSVSLYPLDTCIGAAHHRELGML